MPVTSKLNLQSSYNNVSQSDANGSTVDQFSLANFQQNFASGTAASQVDRAFRDTTTLVSTTKTYTLSALPGSIAMIKVRKLLIYVTSAIGSGATGILTFGSSNGWTNGIGGPITLLPGSIVLLTWPALAGAAVVSGSNDQFKITSTGTLAYTLSIEGTSA